METISIDSTRVDFNQSMSGPLGGVLPWYPMPPVSGTARVLAICPETMLRLLFTIAALTACSEPSGDSLAVVAPEVNQPVETSYYHWTSTVDIDPAWTQNFQPHRLYIKMLDMAHRGKLEAVVSRVETEPGVTVVPVVYMDLDLLRHLEVPELEAFIVSRIPPDRYTALQMDCDWTLQTREAYFELLRGLAEHYSELSATIRLHQVKYFDKTGVPPVSRGALMYYNMSDIQDIEIDNYILDLETARMYHHNFESYPLPLDLALPLYAQGRVIRYGKLVSLIDPDDLQADAVRDIGDGSMRSLEVTRGHYADGRFIYEGDRVSIEDLQQATQGLAHLMQPAEVIFYDQQSSTHYDPEALQTVVDALR
jgi:hypothetical protein